MKTFLFSFLFVLVTQFLTGQSGIKIKELGLTFNNLNSFGIRYKKGNDNK